MRLFYFFFISFTGVYCQNTIYDNTVYLQNDSINSLTEILIIADQNEKKGNNRIIYSVKKDVLSQNSKGDKVLKSIPFLHENQSSYTYSGKKAKIFVNGNEDVNGEIIKSIPYKLIKSVEVIPVSGAEYSTSENISIINVTLKKNIENSFFQELKSDIGILNNNNSFFSSSIISGERWLLNIPIRYNSNNMEIIKDIYSDSPNHTNSINTNKKEAKIFVTPSFNMNFDNSIFSTTAYVVENKQYNKTHNFNDDNNFNNIYAISSTYKQDLNTDKSFQIKGSYVFSNMKYDINQVKNETKSVSAHLMTEFNSQADTLFHIPLDYTLGYNFRYNQNNYSQQYNGKYDIMNNNIYISNRSKLYRNLDLFVNINTSIYNKTFLNENITNLFFLPTLNLSYSPNNSYSFNFEYAYRVNLPTSFMLDEKEITTDNVFYTKGNVNLKEERKNYFSLEAKKKIFNNYSYLKLRSSLEYVNNGIVSKTYQDEDTNRIITQHINGNDYTHIGNSLSFFTFLDGKTLIQLQYELNYTNIDVQNGGFYNIYNLYSKYKISKSLFVELQSSFTSKMYQSNYTTKSLSPTLYLNINKSFMKDKVFVELSMLNPFGLGNKSEITYKNIEGSTIVSKINNKMSNIYITLSYRFGNEKQVNASSYD